MAKVVKLANQFVDFLGKKVLVKTKRSGNYTGRVLREDPYFIVLADAFVIESKSKSPRLAISKRAIIELRELPEEMS